MNSEKMISTRQCLELLLAGNRRFVVGDERQRGGSNPLRRARLVQGQQPFAVVLGCADSRVPPEIVFDRDIGDLFVVRVAGNVAGPSQIGSIEYAVGELGVRLVVVLGHSGCGAVKAAMQEIRESQRAASPALRSILDLVRPAVVAAGAGGSEDEAASVGAAVRENIRVSVDELRAKSQTVRDLVAAEQLLIVGAEYSLETGAVELLNERPRQPVAPSE